MTTATFGPFTVCIWALATLAGVLLGAVLAATLLIWGLRLWVSPTMNQIEPRPSRALGRLVSMAVSTCAAAGLLFLGMAVAQCGLSLAAVL